MTTFLIAIGLVNLGHDPRPIYYLLPPINANFCGLGNRAIQFVLNDNRLFPRKLEITMEFFLLNSVQRTCVLLPEFNLMPAYQPPPLIQHVLNNETYLKRERVRPGNFTWTNPTIQPFVSFRVIDSEYHFHDCVGATFLLNVMTGIVENSYDLDADQRDGVEAMMNQARLNAE